MIIQKGQHNGKSLSIAALSRNEMRGMTPLGKPHVVVSITSPGDSEVEIKSNPEVLLRLYFYDLQKPVGEYTTLFTREMAEQIVKTVEESIERIKCIIVHCDAGVSRSVAIAAALSKVYFGDDFKFFDLGVPNSFVYKTMIECLMGVK